MGGGGFNVSIGGVTVGTSGISYDSDDTFNLGLEVGDYSLGDDWDDITGKTQRAEAEAAMNNLMDQQKAFLNEQLAEAEESKRVLESQRLATRRKETASKLVMGVTGTDTAQTAVSNQDVVRRQNTNKITTMNTVDVV